MSRSDELAAFISALPVSANNTLPAFAMRAKDLDSELVAQFEKKARGCIVIAWLGGVNPDRDSRTLRIGSRYSISIWLPRIPQADMPPIDDIAETLAVALHGWVSEAPGSLVHPLQVTAIDPVQDPDFQVAAIFAEVFRI